MVLASCILLFLAQCKKKNDHSNGSSCNTEAYIGHDSTSLVFVPTAFTPNSDGRNDIFRAFVINASHSYHLSVVLANDNVVFETTDPAKGWDGKLNNGDMAPAGVYHVYLQYLPDSGPQTLVVTKNMCVTLFRNAPGGCINTAGQLYYFEDQFDPVTVSTKYATGEKICP